MIPKRGAIAGVLTAVGLALLLSFKTPEVSNLTANSGGNNAVAGNGSNSGAANGGNTAGGNTTGSTSRGTYSGTVTGQAVQIPFGVVQVQVIFQNGKITDVQAVQLPNGDRHTNEVSNYAGPQLRSEALNAQSAQIDTVSGATYTSEGYIQSLQSALDQVPA